MTVLFLWCKSTFSFVADQVCEEQAVSGINWSAPLPHCRLIVDYRQCLGANEPFLVCFLNLCS